MLEWSYIIVITGNKTFIIVIFTNSKYGLQTSDKAVHGLLSILAIIYYASAPIGGVLAVAPCQLKSGIWWQQF